MEKMVQFVNKDPKIYKPVPSDIEIIVLTKEWVLILKKPSAFEKVICK